MRDFEYINPARIIFGSKPYERIKNIIEENGVKSLLMI